MNIEIEMAKARVRQKLAATRAEAALARLGGNGRHEIRPRNYDDVYEKPPLRSSSTVGLSAEELLKDAASIKKIIGVWRRIGKRDASPVKLASGRWVIPKGSTGLSVSARENALGRPRHRKGGR